MADESISGLKIDWDTRVLTANGAEQKLPPKAAHLLNKLLESSPEMVTREELIQAVWDGNAFVGEKSLTNNIWQIRKALNELNVEFELTNISKNGYILRFAQQCSSAGSETQANPQIETSLKAKVELSKSPWVTLLEKVRFKHLVYLIILAASLLILAPVLIVFFIQLLKSLN